MSAIAPQSPVSRGSPVLSAGETYESTTRVVSDIVLRRPSGSLWQASLAGTALLVMLLTGAAGYLFLRGVGIWGINIPVAWGFAIVNFVWWIGIGHAGTFISAFLLLLRQDWRTSINRFAEAMTLFAIACAAMFPLMHLGRPWEFFWLLPYPNTMDLWPQFRSPLVWDVFAVSTYGIISLTFWFIGLIPDLATLRDRATSPLLRKIFGIVALGWRGSARHWQHYQASYLLLAGLAAPLVVSVHSVVSVDFAAAQLPGWHDTIFPPYFVAGAIFSGFAMVLSLAIPLRIAFGLQDYITIKHLENCAKLMLCTGLIVAYGYGADSFYGWYSGNEFDWYMQLNRMQGHYAVFYWMLIACNVATPQLLWFRKIRRGPAALFVISLIVNLGMWLERFVIVIVSLHRDFMPSAWGVYRPTVWDWATLLGSVGLFIFCFLLFVRILPVISMFELRELVHEQSDAHASHEKSSTQSGSEGTPA